MKKLGSIHNHRIRVDTTNIGISDLTTLIKTKNTKLF